MCGGVRIAGEYTRDGKPIRIYFPNPKAALPVLTESGVEWLPWGRRREEPGHGPAGGWARTESITEGRWQKYTPQPAAVPVEAFMEKDEEKVSHWFESAGGARLEALVVGEDAQRRVYLVTGPAPANFAWAHDRWPVAIEEESAPSWGELRNG